MRVELLWWEGCPSHPRALQDLREALRAAGEPSQVEVRHVGSDEEALRERFTGSPTIRIEGEDVVPPTEGEPFALTCRVYRLRDGTVSPVPDPQDVRDAVTRTKEIR